MKSKKGQSLSINTIIIAVLALLVLVVLVIIFNGNMGKTNEGLQKNAKEDALIERQLTVAGLNGRLVAGFAGTADVDDCYDKCIEIISSSGLNCAKGTGAAKDTCVAGSVSRLCKTGSTTVVCITN